MLQRRSDINYLLHFAISNTSLYSESFIGLVVDLTMKRGRGFGSHRSSQLDVPLVVLNYYGKY